MSKQLLDVGCQWTRTDDVSASGSAVFLSPVSASVCKSPSQGVHGRKPSGMLFNAMKSYQKPQSEFVEAPPLRSVTHGSPTRTSVQFNFYLWDILVVMK
jgi:hypothetical protein